MKPSRRKVSCHADANALEQTSLGGSMITTRLLLFSAEEMVPGGSGACSERNVWKMKVCPTPSVPSGRHARENRSSFSRISQTRPQCGQPEDLRRLLSDPLLRSHRHLL